MKSCKLSSCWIFKLGVGVGVINESSCSNLARFDSLKTCSSLVCYTNKPSSNIFLSLLKFQTKFEQSNTQLVKFIMFKEFMLLELGSIKAHSRSVRAINKLSSNINLNLVKFSSQVWTIYHLAHLSPLA